MPTSDIYLRKNETRAVGDLELATGESAAADIALRPNWATAVLGGGKGSNSDGDLVMREKSGENRIHLDAAGGGKVSKKTRVYATGDEMPRSNQPRGFKPAAEYPVTIEGKRAQMTLGAANVDGLLSLYSQSSRGRPGVETVRMQGGDGSLQLGGSGGGNQQQLGADGTLDVVNERWQTACSLDAGTGRLTLGTEGHRGGSFGAVSGAIELNHESGATTAEVRGDAGSLVAGGKNTEGSVLLRHTASNGDTVEYHVEATQQGLEFSTMKRTGGANPSLKNNTAMRIEPDGSVAVKGGSVKSL